MIGTKKVDARTAEKLLFPSFLFPLHPSYPASEAPSRWCSFIRIAAKESTVETWPQYQGEKLAPLLLRRQQDVATIFP